MTKIAEKIAKILAKAENTNHAAEAESLMAKVIEMLNEHGLSMADVASADANDPVALQRDAIGFWASASYKLHLYNALARYYGCQVIYQRVGNRLSFDVAGRESARVTFLMMAPFIDKQVNAAARELIAEGHSSTMSRATRAIGNALTIRIGRLIVEQTKVSETIRAERGFGLVPVDQVRAVIEEAYPSLKQSKGRGIRTSSAAKEKASSISFHRQATGAGQLKIGAR